MKKIGVLFGMENTFPGALVDRINAMEIDGIQAEFVHVGGVNMAAPSGYAVIVDRISHDIPFYRSFLKNAALTGTQIINNPFWWSADDKFFNYALAHKLGVAVPKTVLLPHKKFPPQTNERSMRNLQFPLDWDGIFDYVGFPAFLKPHDGGGWRDVHHVHNRDEFFHAYDKTRDLCMTLQAAVNFQEYFRCYVVGQSEVRIMPYDPRRPHEHRYVLDPPAYDKKLLKRVEKDALTLCKALGYDLNTVEFAVRRRHPLRHRLHEPRPRRRPPLRRQRKLRLDRQRRSQTSRQKSPEPNQTRTPLGLILGFGQEISNEKNRRQKNRSQDSNEKSSKENGGVANGIDIE